MAVTVDISNIADIHPKNKQDVGKRLALWALAKDYGQTNLVYSGPLYKVHEGRRQQDPPRASTTSAAGWCRATASR